MHQGGGIVKKKVILDDEAKSDTSWGFPLKTSFSEGDSGPMCDQIPLQFVVVVVICLI